MKTHRQKKSCAAKKVTINMRLRKKSRSAKMRRARRLVSRRFSISRRRAAKSHLRSDPRPSFASLDFPGRQILYPFEIADRIGCSTRHVNELVFEGQLRAVDISCRDTGTIRKTVRIPIESYRQFLLDRII
jgi:hypothetical protein